MTGAASLRIDPDGLSDVLVEIERSFAIDLPQDMRHVHTAGDLHREIVTRAGPAEGDVCPTSRVFYAVRRTLVTGGARPDTALASLGLRSPRAVRRLLAERRGWRSPPLTVGPIGCAALLLGAITMASGWWIGNPGMVVASPVLALVLLRLDPGAWKGSWATLGALSRGVAAANHAQLVEEGASHSPATTWHALVALLQQTMPERLPITRDSRLLA